MKNGSNRRQWLLGMVGAIFGTSAAQAVDRLLPGAKREPLDGVQLKLTIYQPDGSRSIQHEVVLGRVLIECDQPAGAFRVLRYDKEGQLIGTHESEMMEVSLRRVREPSLVCSFQYDGPADVNGFSLARPGGGLPGSVVTYTYDAKADRLQG